MRDKAIIMPENPVSHFLFNDTRSGLIWLIIRLYVGYTWLTAGWGKVRSDAWTGEQAGGAVQGFVGGALAKSAEGGDVSGWYATFLETVVLRMPKRSPI